MCMSAISVQFVEYNLSLKLTLLNSSILKPINFNKNTVMKALLKMPQATLKLNFAIVRIVFYICYRNILSLLWENRVLSSWDFFSSRCFWASSKRFTCRSSSRSNGLLSTGVSAFSFAFSFIVFVCKLIRDSARLDSWLQQVKKKVVWK